MHYLRILAVASTFASCIVALPHERRKASGLNAAAKAAGKLYFGTATDAGLWKDTAYDNILDDLAEFGQLTPENSMKWGHTEPQQGKFDYSGGDALVQLAEKTGKILRCHALVWHGNVPSWITEGSWNKETLTAVMKNHVTNVASHFKGKCYAWDVVNEAFNQDGTYRESIFYKTIGPDFIPIAFAAAAAADPGAKLYYNDYSIEVTGKKSDATRNLVKSLKSRGIKIDGVGIQSHFGIGGGTPSHEAQKGNMEAFTALGVEVALTELDIHMALPTTPANLETQRGNYRDSVGACAQVKGCVGVTVWGFSDKYSWISRPGSNKGAACVWDRNLQKKPAYSGIMDAFGGASTPAAPYTQTDSTTKGPAKTPAQKNYSPESTTTHGHKGSARTFTTADLTTFTTRTSTKHRTVVEYPTGSATTKAGPDSTPPAPSDSGADSTPPATTDASPPATTDSGADSTPPAASSAGAGFTPLATTDSSPDTPATTPAPSLHPTAPCAAPSTITVSTEVTITITGPSGPTPTPAAYSPPSPTSTKAPKGKKGRGPCSKKGTGTKAAGPKATGGSAVAKHWKQCGGQGWTGPTSCEKPWTCRVQGGNQFYSQCL